MPNHQRLAAMIHQDKSRMAALRALQSLSLPDSWIAAGFVRNLVWDQLHGITTPLNDLDVIYFCTADTSPSRDRHYQQLLWQRAPAYPWSVKNQARMHLRHGDAPYDNCRTAMRHWPEHQTAVAARLAPDGALELNVGFELDSLLAGIISANPRRGEAIAAARICRKGWLSCWPTLQIATPTLAMRVAKGLT